MLNARGRRRRRERTLPTADPNASTAQAAVTTRRAGDTMPSDTRLLWHAGAPGETQEHSPGARRVPRRNQAISRLAVMPKALFRCAALLTAIAGCSGQILGKSTHEGDTPPGPGGGSGAPPVGGGGGAGGGGAPPTGETATCNPAQKSFAPARVWQLTDEEYVNVVRDVFGVTLTGEDARIGSAGSAGRYTNYSEELSIDTQAAPNYQTAAAKVADLAQAR